MKGPSGIPGLEFRCCSFIGRDESVDPQVARGRAAPEQLAAAIEAPSAKLILD